MIEFTQLSQSRKAACLVIAALLTATVAIGAATHRQNGPSGGDDPVTRRADDGAVSIDAILDRTSVLAGGDGLVRMELALAAEKRGEVAIAQTPTDLVVILDRSGSMNGQKIHDARNAIHQLISQLRPEDRFSLVTFSSGAATAIPLAQATAEARERWAGVVGGLHAGGGTFMATGLSLGLEALETARAAGRSSRAILISDGLAAEPLDVLRPLAARAVSGEYTLSAVGVGEDFDENMMSSLADAGTGNYFYLEDAAALAQVFAAEFETARETVAAALSVTIDPGPGVQVVEAAGYPLERVGRKVRFRPGSLFSGQDRRVWITLRVPANAPGEHGIGAVRVDYTDRGERRRLTVDDFPKVACVEDEAQFFADLDVDTWAKSVAVEEYNELRQSVARLVKSGKKEKASTEIGRFIRRNAAFNRHADSLAVQRQLGAAMQLEADVAEAFTGDDAKHKQNRLGKALHAEGYNERRSGSRK